MRHRIVMILMLVTLTALGQISSARADQRGVNVLPAVAAGAVSITGDYWALIIGIDRYQHAPKLESAVRDAKGLRDVLMERYGFKKERIVELYDAQATGPKILNALYRLGRETGKDDSVLIYYAGHGQYEEDGKLGWWVPVEGEPREPGTFITNSSIRDYVNGMKARHVYLVADSCFSGTLFGTRALPPINDQWYSRLYQKQSRWGLTSGGTEPVADRGKEGHSVFAYHLITLLKENTDPYLVPSQIHTKLAPLVANNADQTPQSEPLKGAGDEGGQFVFRLASATGGPLPGENVSKPSSIDIERQALEAERQRLQQERDRIERDRREAVERARLEMERKQLEAERERLAEERRRAEEPTPILEARARSYDMPQRTGRGVTGRVSYNGRSEAKEFLFSKFPNPYFCRQNPNRDLIDGDKRLLKTIDVGRDGGLKGAIVAVTDIYDTSFMDSYAGTDVAAEYCHFSRYTGVVVKGKNFRVENRDADPSDPKSVRGVLHNPHSFEVLGGASSTVFNIGLAVKGDRLDKPVILRRDGSMFRLQCDQHEFMQAFFLPVTNPYYSMVQDDGTFEIRGVPPGRHRLIAWHPYIGKAEAEIYVSDDGSAQTNFELRK